MFVRALRPSAWLVPAGAALIYLMSLSALLVEESGEPRLLVVASLGLSFLAGFVIRRVSALVLPLGVIALALLWVPHVDEDAIVAMVGGLLGGLVLARVYERMERIDLTRGPGDVLDRLLEASPRDIYRRVAFLPTDSESRAGFESRWEAMFPVLCEQGVESAVDIGARDGYFSIRLGRACIPTIAVEPDPSNCRTAMVAVRRNRLDDVGVLALELTPNNVLSVPASDCALCLSVWHRLVRDHGLGGATDMLEAIWSRTGKVLFFDADEHGLEPDPPSWLAAYLAETCTGSRIEHLGTHEAFEPSGRPCERNLFAVIRA